MSIVVEGPAADEVAVDHTWFINKDPTANFQIETAFQNSGHFATAYAICICWYFDAMADTRNRFIRFEKVLGDTY
jgi:hypothetical protein